MAFVAEAHHLYWYQILCQGLKSNGTHQEPFWPLDRLNLGGGFHHASKDWASGFCF